MQITDTIADMLTRIPQCRARQRARHCRCSRFQYEESHCQYSSGGRLTQKLPWVLEDNKQGVIRIVLKYGENKTPVITGTAQSFQARPAYLYRREDMPRVMKGLGIAILSTSKGVMTGKQAKAEKVGGEILAFVW